MISKDSIVILIHVHYFCWGMDMTTILNTWFGGGCILNILTTNVPSAVF
jgi:hypothetical protein